MDIDPGLADGACGPRRQLLPWNGGRKPTCSVALKYVDEDMRIVADGDGEMFVYMRPVDPRGLLRPSAPERAFLFRRQRAVLDFLDPGFALLRIPATSTDRL